MRVLSITAFFLFIVLQVYAGDPNAVWQKANKCYQQKQYDSAALYYEQIAALNPGNAVIYFNLGNTYYRLNKIGPAILNFERALKIDPDYKEAQDNLALTQGRISNQVHPHNDIFFVRWWESITRADRAAMWSVAALITFVLFMLTLFLRRFNSSLGPRIPIQVQGVLLFVFLCVLGIAFTASRNHTEHTGAVVMQNDAALMNAGLKGKPQALVPEGTVVKINSYNGEWIEVSLPDGRTGWMLQSLVTKI